MDRVFRHYDQWEDYNNGMYLSSCDDVEQKKALSFELLGSAVLFQAAALDMVSNWPISASVFLTNTSINRLAWIGQATCCREYGSPEFVTIMAWCELGKEQQDAANEAARIVLKLWTLKIEEANAQNLF